MKIKEIEQVTKHIFPFISFLYKKNDFKNLKLFSSVQLEYANANMEDYIKVNNPTSIYIFKHNINNKINVPELFIHKNEMESLDFIINHSKNLIELEKQFKANKTKYSTFSKKEKNSPEFVQLNSEMSVVTNMSVNVEEYFSKIVNESEKILKKDKRKKDKIHTKELSLKLNAQIQSYHELFPVARSLQRKVKLFIGPTNSGKTYNALNELLTHKKGVYLAPLRLLALEGQAEIESRNELCSFITGEEKEIKPNAKFTAQTIETFNFHNIVDAVLIDEVQMISDIYRGWAWTQAFIGAPAKNIILTGSLDSLSIVQDICNLLGDELEIINLNRFTNLKIEHQAYPLSVESVKELEENSAIIVFSRKSVLSYKAIFEKAEIPVSIIYGNLSPEVRREEARKFRTGETKFLISTDAIAMGLNLPIKRVIFGEIQKFNGVKVDYIMPNEVRQIAGRAGRYGKFDEGFVSAQTEDELAFIREQIEIKTVIPKILYVRPTLNQVELLSELLKTESLEIIYNKFFKLIQNQNNIYQCSDLTQIQELLMILDQSSLSLEDKFRFANLPIDTGNEKSLIVFREWVASYANNEPVFAEKYLHVPAKKSQISQLYLLNAEINIKILTAYAWLAQQMPVFAPDKDKCKALKAELNDYIIHCLNTCIGEKNHCAECGKEMKTSFRTCYDCYQENSAKF